jgi:glycosyltransferase 2 family protein
MERPTTGPLRRGGTRKAAPTANGTVLPTSFDKLLRTALVIIPIGVIGNLAFSLLVTDRALLGTLGDLPRGYLLAALLLGIVPWFTNSLRLLIWTRFLDHRLRYREAFQITLATDLAAAVTPTAVGGGFLKWGLLVQRGVSPGAAASITTLTPLEDALFFLVAIPIALYVTASWGHPVFHAVADQFQENALPVLLATSAIAGLSWIAARWVLGGGLGQRTQRRSQRLLVRILKGIRASWVDARQSFRLIGRDGKAWFALSMTLSAIQWTARYSIVSVLLAFLGAPVRPVLYWVLQWVVFTLATFIPTPGAAGGAEAAFFLIYAPFVPTELIGLAVAGWRFFTFYLLLAIAALPYIILRSTGRAPR